MSFEIIALNRIHEMEWPLIVNSRTSWIAASHILETLWNEHKFITISKPRIGPDRSLSQNNLFHQWATECWFHYQSLPIGKITPRELASMKRSLKKIAYNANGWPWLVHEIVDVFDNNKPKRDYTSSADWSRGEMFEFLTWMQNTAANTGLILESKGEFNKLQREQMG